MLRRIGATVLLGVLIWGALAPSPHMFGAENPIVVENQQPGSSGWLATRMADDVSGQIKGYASATSVSVNGSITFHVTVNPAQPYTIDIYRIGWYAGSGGRRRLHVGPLDGVRQPTCDSDPTTGLIACNWVPSYTLSVPSDWTSGVYVAVLTNTDGFQNYVTFVVRDGRPAPLLYQRAVATDQAYNNYPNDGATGKSLYSFNSYGATTVSGQARAVKVSFDRPYTGAGAGFFGNAEINFVRWLERSGYDVTYSTDIDTHENGGGLRNHKGFLSVGRNEYWSKEMFDAAEAARDAGVSLGFFGAAAVDLQTRFEPSAAGVADRVMVAYNDAALDPVHGPTTTVPFRFAPVNRPEQTLRGVQALFTAPSANTGFVVTNSSHWVYQGTGLTDGDVVPGIVGREIDRLHTDYPEANSVSFTLLSRSPFTDPTGASDIASASIYQAPSGAWVFSAGTTSWSWALDDFGHGLANAGLQRATANILSAFVSGAPAPVSALTLVAPATATAGTAFAVSVAAHDASGNPVTSYSGPVHFSTSDTASGVVLPPDATLTGGQGTFSVTLATAGSQTLTVSDAARSLSASATVAVTTPTPPPVPGLRVEGNRLVDTSGHPVILRGVDRSGTEYMCAQDRGIVDGPIDQASITAIKSWHINVVRVPLNEHCWLGIDDGAETPQFIGEAYRQAVGSYVDLLVANGLYVILDLHWSGAAGQPATTQQPMPNVSHSADFWTSVATRFKNDGRVVFDLFNEPVPNNNESDATEAAARRSWECWRDGGSASCDAELSLGRPGTSMSAGEAVGMQTLVDAVRATGATNVIMLGGIQWAHTLWSGATTNWLAYRPADPLGNLVAQDHVYAAGPCATVSCYDSEIAPVAAQVPVVVGEFGIESCDEAAATWLNTLMGWLDGKQSGYLAWTWNTAWAGVDPCATFKLISDFDGSSTPYGQIYRAHLAPSTHLALTTTSASTAGTPFTFTVTALDQFGNLDPAYAGTVHFTSSDTSAGVVLPADSTLANGQATFSATLTTTGSQTITGADTLSASITGTLNVVVGAAVP